MDDGISHPRIALRGARARRYIVLGGRVKAFDELDRAKAYALRNPRCVVCERRIDETGRSELIEILRYDHSPDSERPELHAG